jgi:TPR repeat protein
MNRTLALAAAIGLSLAVGAGPTSGALAQPRSPVLKDPSAQRSPFYLRQDRSTEVLFDAFMLARKASGGDPVSQHSLGLLYLQGIDFAPDTVRAAEWITRAADQEYLPAIYNLGILKFNGWGTAWDPFGAYGNFKKAAEGGLPEGMYMTGLLHTDNLVVKRDYAQAWRWLRAAADSGNANAAEVLVEFEKAGIMARIRKDAGATAGSATSAAGKDSGAVVSAAAGTGNAGGNAAGSPRSAGGNSGGTGSGTAGQAAAPSSPPAWTPVFVDFDTDTLADPDDSTLAADAFRLGDSTMERTAAAGAPEALTYLGRRSERGTGVEADRIGAALWYLRAVRNESRWAPVLLWRLASGQKFYDYLAAAIGRGDLRASFVWAGLLARGLDARLTEAQALDHLRRAAEGGMTDALLELASWYESGSIVPRDQKAADSLLTLAVRAGSREAEVRYIMGSLRRGGSAGELHAMTDSLAAAEKDGSLLAQAIIGRCYEKGTGFPVNLPRAVGYYRKAAQRGSRLAYDALKALYDSRRPDDPEFALDDPG